MSTVPLPEPPDGEAWDLLVLGGGTAGIVGAKTAASLGASVLLVEQARPGGDCLWTGCVPSKALLSAAHSAAAARGAKRHGIHVDSVRVDFGEVMVEVHAAIADIAPVDSADALHEAGVRVATGTARFTGPGAARVGEVPVSFRQALIATGARPALPDLPGLAAARPRTSETIWELTSLPGRLLVVGGGSVGCELGQAFARLGSAVTLVEAGPRLLPHEDADAAALVLRALRADGADVRVDTVIERVDESAVTLGDGSAIEFDVVLVCTGRVPRTERLGLDTVDVELDATGHVVVDAHLQAADRHVWAAGDVTARSRFTHTAGVHASIAASNAVLGLRRSIGPGTPPRVTFTQPEVAAVGVGAAQAERDGLTVRQVEHEDVDRAVAERHVAGFSRLVLDGKGRIVGATIVGPRAGESLGEAALAVQQGVRARDLAGTVHAYPTYSDGIWNAAVADVRAGLARPTARRVTGLLGRVRRVWVSR